MPENFKDSLRADGAHDNTPVSDKLFPKSCVWNHTLSFISPNFYLDIVLLYVRANFYTIPTLTARCQAAYSLEDPGPCLWLCCQPTERQRQQKGSESQSPSVPTDRVVVAPLPPAHPTVWQPRTPPPRSLYRAPRLCRKRQAGAFKINTLLCWVKVKSSSSKTTDDTFLASNKTHNSNQAFLSQEIKSISSF